MRVWIKWLLSALLVNPVAAFMRNSARKIQGQQQQAIALKTSSSTTTTSRLQSSYLDNLGGGGGGTNTGGGTPSFEAYMNNNNNNNNPPHPQNEYGFHPEPQQQMMQSFAPPQQQPSPVYANDKVYDARPTFPIPTLNGGNAGGNTNNYLNSNQDFSSYYPSQNNNGWNNGNNANGNNVNGDYSSQLQQQQQQQQQQQTGAPYNNSMNQPAPPAPAAAVEAPTPPPATDPSLFFLQQNTNGGWASSSSSSSSPPQQQSQQLDPFSGFPASVMRELPSSTDSDMWKREISNLKQTVSSLSNQVSGFSSQLASVAAASSSTRGGAGGAGPVPTMAEIENAIKNQFARVMEAQTGVNRQLESSIAEVRMSLADQEQWIQVISQKEQKDQEQSTRMTNLSQTVQAMQNNVELSRATQKQLEERLKAMERRLEEQQEELRTASTRTDPRVMVMEAKLKEQADLLKQAMSNPESRLSALETKIGQLQQELLTMSQKPESRVAALEAKMREQQARLEAAAAQPDPRIAMIEAKMKVQEEQIRAATEAISDSRITALRAKLIEQQEQLEAAAMAQQVISPPSGFGQPFSPTPPPSSPKNPAPALLSNPFGGGSGGDSPTSGGDSKKSWMPWGQSSKSSQKYSPQELTPPAPPAEEPVEQDGYGFLDQQRRFPSPSTAFGTYQSPVNGSYNNNNEPFPSPPSSPPSFGSDQSYNYANPPKPTTTETTAGAFKGLAFGRGKGITTEPTSQEGRPAFPTVPASNTNAQARFSPPPPSNDPVGSFKGQAFGRGSGITIETGEDQRGSPPPPFVPASPRPSSSNQGRPAVAPDQDLWDQHQANPDAVKRPLYELPKNPNRPSSASAGSSEERRLAKIASDQDQWDPERPNPDAVKRPLIEKKSRQRDANGVARGVTSDQGRWKSDAQVQRDIEDQRPVAARPRAPAATSEKSDASLFRKSQLLTAYLDWCRNYGSQPSENRFQQFSQNYAKMEAVAQQTGQFPAFNAFADYSEEEFARMNAAAGGGR